MFFSSCIRAVWRASPTLPMFSVQNRRNLVSRLKCRCLGLWCTAPFQRMIRYIRLMIMQPLVFYAILWTSFLAVCVAIAALSLEMGFSATVSTQVQHLEACSLLGLTSSCRHCFGLPLDSPHDGLCVPSLLFKKSNVDFLVPPIFAGLVVMGSALLVQALHIFEG